MEDGVKRLQITLQPTVLEKLDVIARDAGLKRSAVIAMAISDLWKKEGYEHGKN